MEELEKVYFELFEINDCEVQFDEFLGGLFYVNLKSIRKFTEQEEVYIGEILSGWKLSNRTSFTERPPIRFSFKSIMTSTTFFLYEYTINEDDLTIAIRNKKLKLLL